MPNTPGGLPYPAGTDFLVDGDNAIRALAEEQDGPVYSLWKQTAGSGGLKPLVSGAIPFDGVKSGSDGGTLSADKTILTLPRTGLYRIDPHLGLAGNAGVGVSAALWVNGASFSDSLMYGNTGAAGAFIAGFPVWVVATANVTTIQWRVTAPLGTYDWSWMRVTYERRNRA